MAIGVKHYGNTSITTTPVELAANTTDRTPLRAVLERPAAIASGDVFEFYWEAKLDAAGDSYKKYGAGYQFGFQTLGDGMEIPWEPINAVATRLMGKKISGTDRSFDWAIYGGP